MRESTSQNGKADELRFGMRRAAPRTAEEAHARKVMNRALELQKEIPTMSLIGAVRMAQRLESNPKTHATL